MRTIGRYLASGFVIAMLAAPCAWAQSDSTSQQATLKQVIRKIGDLLGQVGWRCKESQDNINIEAWGPYSIERRGEAGVDLVVTLTESTYLDVGSATAAYFSTLTHEFSLLKLDEDDINPTKSTNDDMFWTSGRDPGSYAEAVRTRGQKTAAWKLRIGTVNDVKCIALSSKCTSSYTIYRDGSRENSPAGSPLSMSDNNLTINFLYEQEAKQLAALWAQAIKLAKSVK